MKRAARFALLFISVLASSVLLTRLWLTRPDLFPEFPKPLAEYLVHIYGAQDAEQVADLELLVGLVLSFVVVSAIAALVWVLASRIKTKP